MPAGGTKTRFGRCPYCRAMICQSTTAAIYYCTKCRTPIRGKNTEPTDDETDNTLSSLEILSAVDTESVFSDELEGSSTQPSVIDVDGDQPPFSCGYNSNSDANSQGIAAASSPSPYRGFGSPRAGQPRSNSCVSRGVEDGRVGSDGQDEVRVVRPVNSRVDALRASSRRTRRASSASDPSILRRRDFSVPDPEEAPRNASSGQQLRQSALSSRELRTSASVSAVTASPLTDPAFQRDLLHALDKLRGMIANIELQPRSTSGGSGAFGLMRIVLQIAFALGHMEHVFLQVFSLSLCSNHPKILTLFGTLEDHTKFSAGSSSALYMVEYAALEHL
uniref:Uncharacterized protein n=1 Tax=Aegilops tauschii TaxID=37682 RepID=M8BS50_AEGTA